MNIVYWGKYIDTYLMDTLTRLQELVSEPIHYVLVEESFTRRQAKGEKLVDPSVNPVTLLHHRGFVKMSMDILDQNKDAIHIFLSFWGDRRLFGVLLSALWRKCKVVVIFESYSTVPHGYWKDEEWLRSRLKVLGRHTAYRMLWPILQLLARNKPPCIMAVSPLAEEQLRRVGFSERVFYPFGYFLERKIVEQEQVAQAGVLRVIFSGSLIKRKGLDVAIAAVKRANSVSVRVMLDIYGPGDIGKFLVDGLPGICYKGVYSQEDAQKIISGYDLLLVPSHHEGWGLVVNEALMQEVPVVVSDRVGAKTLVESSGAGLIFETGNIAQLADLLTDLSAHPDKIAIMKSRCAVVRDLITPRIGADYLEKVLKHYFHQIGDKPGPVWSLRR